MAVVAETAETLANLQSDPEPTVSQPAILQASLQGFNLPELLSFDPSSIGLGLPEPAVPQKPIAVEDQLKQIKELLSAPIDSLVKDSDEVKCLVDVIQDQLPESLREQLWSAGHLPFFRARVEAARRRIELRRSQASLRADIVQRCDRLKSVKVERNAKTNAIPSTEKLELLKVKLSALEAEVVLMKQQITDEEASIVRSKEEAEALTLQMKKEIEDLQALHRQVVLGEDRDDEAIIAEADRVQSDAISAIDAILAQSAST